MRLARHLDCGIRNSGYTAGGAALGGAHAAAAAAGATATKTQLKEPVAA